ncbi:MAG: hypothetical protein WD490_06540 [Opitutales bacterium]
MPLSHSEDISRAICSDKWDGERLSPSLFKGTNTSVSRLAITPLEDTWALFRQRIARPPKRALVGIGEINVGRLCDLGVDHEPSVSLTVEPDPQDAYPSHAVIPQNITRRLANKIVKALEVHWVLESNGWS